jgi:hypothetical protein
VVELDRAAEASVDPRLARRLVALELADVSVAPPPTLGDAEYSLYVRVRGAADSRLRVELWEHGRFQGARVLPAVDPRPELVARRIAVAAATLARQLRVKRQTELAREAEADARRAEVERILMRLERLPSARLAVGPRTALVGPAELWLMGVHVEGQLRLVPGLTLGMFGGGYGGKPSALPRSLAMRWAELGLAPGVVLPLGRGVELAVNAEAAAAALELPEATSVDGDRGRKQTWSARAGGRVQVVLPFPALDLAIGPDAGVLLKHVPVEDSRGSASVGPLWLGLSAAFVLGRPLVSPRMSLTPSR